MAETQTWQPLDREALAARVARDIPEGWSVNLGIGIPTLVGNYVPPEREWQDNRSETQLGDNGKQCTKDFDGVEIDFVYALVSGGFQ